MDRKNAPKNLNNLPGRCHCGKIASYFTSKTPYNSGRRFFKCPKLDISSCGYWEWQDDVVPDRVLITINNMNYKLDVANVKLNNMKSTLDVIILERDRLKERVDVLKALKNSEVNKARKLEEKVLNMKIFIMISWAIFIGVVAAMLMN
uniref:GRF-type domain-containing protein n=1 Tax=Nicotiana tabacum TaxID=4097 RepID=A0A1S3YX59_TOBAC|nr:PREDICTED: uncharacterized protein LOC107780704 [Nicotiana tabacum]